MLSHANSSHKILTKPKGKWFILGFSSKLQPIVVEKSRSQALKAAGHKFTVRESSESLHTSAQLAFPTSQPGIPAQGMVSPTVGGSSPQLTQSR